jgi:hypothetical protein
VRDACLCGRDDELLDGKRSAGLYLGEVDSCSARIVAQSLGELDNAELSVEWRQVFAQPAVDEAPAVSRT